MNRESAVPGLLFVTRIGLPVKHIACHNLQEPGRLFKHRAVRRFLKCVKSFYRAIQLFIILCGNIMVHRQIMPAAEEISRDLKCGYFLCHIERQHLCPEPGLTTISRMVKAIRMNIIMGRRYAIIRGVLPIELFIN